MSTNRPDAVNGVLPKGISSDTQELELLESQKLDVAQVPAVHGADDLVRKVAAGIEQALKGFVDHQSRLLDRHRENLSRLEGTVVPTEGEFPFDIGPLKARVEEMRTEALRLLRSENPNERARGQDELTVSVELFNLVLFVLEQQMQIQVHRARIAR